MKVDASLLHSVIGLMVASACVIGTILFNVPDYEEAQKQPFLPTEEMLADFNRMVLGEADRVPHTPLPRYTPSPDFERKDRRIMVAGISRAIEDVRPNVWELLRGYCREFKASIHIQTMLVYNGTMAERELANCTAVVITSDFSATDGVDGINHDSWDTISPWRPFRKLGRRVARITKARTGQLMDLRLYVNHQQLLPTLDAVVVVDMDMGILPSATDIRPAVDAVGLSGKWDAICADGVQALGGYYDTFATVLSFATFVTLPVHPYFRPLIHDANGFTYYYSWLMKRFQDYIRLDPRAFIPVRSCFGGMAIYRPTELMDTSCSYGFRSSATDQVKITAYDGTGDIVCEHVRLHLCMETRSNERGGQFNIGIAKALYTEWKGEDE